ncbi:hypothetical protein Tco_1040602, partial [Tanacetum coccineum]
APQPPLTATPTRTMAQRFSRLEEEVHRLCGDIGPRWKEIDNVGEVSIIWNPMADEAKVSHDLLSNLPHSEVQMRLDGLTFDELVDFHDVSALRFVMSNNILNMEARVLSGDVARLRNEVVSLRNQQADSAILISSLEVKLRDAEGRLGVEEGSLVRNLRA